MPLIHETAVARRCGWGVCRGLLLVGLFITAGCHAQPAVEALSGTADTRGVTAHGIQGRVELSWPRVSDAETESYVVERSFAPGGPFEQVGGTERGLTVYSDYLGDETRTAYYRVGRLESLGATPEYLPVVSARTRDLDDDALLDEIQRACFRYFWDFGHPVSGLARARTDEDRDICVSGGTGFGMFTVMVGVDRGFVGRDAAAARLLKIVTFLEEKTTRYHGAWSHRFNGRTGQTIEFFDPRDNGGDLVETALLMQGMLAVRQYFDADNATETELRDRITRLWEEVEWDWYLQHPGGKVLYWHWSPDHGWAKNHRLHGFNETKIAYILALASPTHPIPAESYEAGWLGNPHHYPNEQTHYGLTQKIGRPMGGPLFLTQYSYLGLDPRAVTDRYVNYFENNRVMSLMHRAYCADNPKGHAGYSELVWGLTSSHNPFKGYRGHAPLTEKDDGTIAPTAALSAFPYTPDESMATARHFYDELGEKLWGPFGFYDAFHLGTDWVSPQFLAIDVGPIAPMIENHRTGLCWEMFMANPEIVPTLKKLDIDRAQ